ncbi:hypothetical protein D3C78_1461370 [compost metagenome]
MTNFTAPPPAKNANTASGLAAAISVSRAWNSTFGKGTVSCFTTLPPSFSKPSLKAVVISSPAAYFQVMVIAVFFFSCLAATVPMP